MLCIPVRVWLHFNSQSEPPTCTLVDHDCSHGDIKLVDGSSKYEGRVEVCVDGAWYTVCDDNYDSDATAVICNQLFSTETFSCEQGSKYYF